VVGTTPAGEQDSPANAMSAIADAIANMLSSEEEDVE
jgi:hypothetical protein